MNKVSSDSERLPMSTTSGTPHVDMCVCPYTCKHAVIHHTHQKLVQGGNYCPEIPCDLELPMVPLPQNTALSFYPWSHLLSSTYLLFFTHLSSHTYVQISMPALWDTQRRNNIWSWVLWGWPVFQVSPQPTSQLLLSSLSLLLPPLQGYSWTQGSKGGQLNTEAHPQPITTRPNLT